MIVAPNGTLMPVKIILENYGSSVKHVEVLFIGYTFRDNSRKIRNIINREQLYKLDCDADKTTTDPLC